MNRTYKKRPLFDSKRLGSIGLALFVVFIAYRILTPPSDTAVPFPSPDGAKEARLKTIFYYDNQPSYKIYWRKVGEKSWRGLYYLPASTNTASGATAGIAWSAQSDRLDFQLNGTSIWYHVFSE